jgi:hypothetical protein
MSIKCLAIVSVLTLFAISAGAVTLIWDDGAADSFLATADNWDSNQVPSSGNDSLSFIGGVTVFIESEFTVGNGQSFSGTNVSNVNQIFRVRDGADITVATGGSLDLTGGAGTGTGVSLFTESGATAANGRRVTVESEATFKMDRYLTQSGWVTEWVADTDSVTTMEISADFRFRATDDVMEVDLTSYVNDVERTLILVDYGTLVGTAETVTISGYDAADYTLDYAYDQGGGDLAIALTIVPEPSTCALMGGLFALVRVMLRRRAVHC